MKLELFVGIDPGQVNLALSCFSPTRGVVSFHKPKPVRDKIELKGVDRLSFLMYEIKMWLDEMGKIGDVKQICIEGYAPNEKFGREMSGETRAVILLSLVGWYGLNDPVAYPSVVGTLQLKKFVTGKAMSAKDVMLLEVYKRWGVDLKDHNLADAYGLARVAHALYCAPQVTQFQQDVLDNLQRHTQWNPALHLDSTEAAQLPLPLSEPKHSSRSAPPLSLPRSPQSSPTPPTGAKRSRSVPSGRVRLIRRTRPVR